MEPSRSALDLDKAILELDGMYNELSATMERNLKPEEEFARAKINYDDEDYDVPRPALGFQKSIPSSKASTLSSFTSNTDTREASESGSQFHSSEPLPYTKSPAPTTNSESSSGFGTLASQRALASPTEFCFPGPPDFEPPPPIPAPPCDSDYDEVASDISDKFLYSHPVKTKKPDKIADSTDYAEIPASGPEELSVSVINVNTVTDKDDGPDYDDVYSVPPSQRSSAFVMTEHETGAYNTMPEGTKIVVQMKRTNYDPEKENVEQNQIQEHSFTTPQVEEKPDSKTGSQQKLDQDRPDDVIANDSLPVDLNSNIAKANTSRPVSLESSVPSSSKTSTVRRSVMDAESQNKPRRRRNDCPCECKAAFPLMSVAVVICIIIFMFVTIAFVYIGVKNDEHLADIYKGLDPTSPTGNVDSSGSGSGGGI